MAQADFAIVPTQEELDSLERELRFFPTENDSPSTLSARQIEQYNRDGYVSGLVAFEEAEANEVQAYFDDLLERTLAAGKDAYSISTAHMKHGRVYDILQHPRIVAAVVDLLGPNVVGWGSHFFCKLPHDGKQVSWHQDATYWPLTPTKTVTVWLAIDDTDAENANMRFVPTSHVHGVLPYRESDAAEGNVLNQTVDAVERFGEPIDNALRAGEFSMHADLLLHGSEANDSDRRRCGLTLRYCAAEVRAHLGWNAKGVVVAGEDAAGHWGNPARPEVE